jgi:hypothetical protein
MINFCVLLGVPPELLAIDFCELDFWIDIIYEFDLLLSSNFERSLSLFFEAV